MKKILIALVAFFALSLSANAMSYEQARRQALFLTDKMAYELNLTDEQYEAAYEVNLDYLMSINTYDELYGVYWQHRNTELSYILFDWQYRSYLAANYFYRPLYWDSGYWRFRVYSRYPHRDYFYFGQPRFYVTYRGSNWRSYTWRDNHNYSRYHNRQFGNGGRFGMRDGYNRGDYRNNSRVFDNDRRSTRSYGNGSSSYDNGYNNGRFGGARRNNDVNRGYENRTRSYGNSNDVNNEGNSGRFGGIRRSADRYSNDNTLSRPSSTRSTVSTPSNQGSMGGGRFGGSRSDYGSSSNRQMPTTRSSSPSMSGGNFGGGSVQSGGGGRFGGGSSSGGESTGGGGRFGGRR